MTDPKTSPTDSSKARIAERDSKLPSTGREGRLALLGVVFASSILAACEWVSSPAPACAALAEWGARMEGDRCVVASLNTATYSGKRLPDRLTVRGDLQIYGQRLAALPRGLIVEGTLDLYKATYELPADLIVHGDLERTLSFGDESLRCVDIPKTVRIDGSIRCE